MLIKVIILFVVLFLLASVSTSHLQHISDGITCDCMKSTRCKHWLSAVNSGKYIQPPICGYDTHSLHPLLCCPRDDDTWVKESRIKRDVLQGQKNIQLSCSITSQTLTPAEVAINKCNEYSKAVLSVFEVSVGDSQYQKVERDTCLKNDEGNSEPREFPHMALLGYGNEDSISWVCGGVLISERYVLTAAHCAKIQWVKLGEFDFSTDEDVAKPVIYKVLERISHPNYKPPILNHDIALLKLNKDVEFNIFIRPACLFTKRDSPDDKAFAVGYGKRKIDGEQSRVPKKIELEIVNVDECNTVFNSTKILNPAVTSDAMICTKATNLTESVCAGDSGGPLQIPLKKPYCMYGIIGITSFGARCEEGVNKPGVSTRVAHYLPWIVQNVWPDQLQYN